MYARNYDASKVLEWEELALAHVEAEIDLFVSISREMAKSFGFLQSRLKTDFPKTCGKCGKCYHSFEEFFFETDAIARGTISYPTLGSDFFLHRNCKGSCGSTLIVVFTDRRDDSELGNRRRAVFQTCLDKLGERLGLGESEARPVLFSLIHERLQR